MPSFNGNITLIKQERKQTNPLYLLLRNWHTTNIVRGIKWWFCHYLIADTQCYRDVCNAYIIPNDSTFLDERVQEIVANLTIDKTTTSKAIRKKTSARDDRPSSKTVGVLGILFLAFTIALMTTSDVIVLTRYVFKILQRALQKALTPSISPNAVTELNPDHTAFDPIYAEDLLNPQSA